LNNHIKITIAEARIDDAGAMASFLAPIPDSEVLGALLATRRAQNTRAYEDERQTARFVVSDGTAAICFTVAYITIDQAELITLACEKAEAWNAVTFPSAASQALGESPEISIQGLST
jgi:hypothetical protein